MVALLVLVTFIVFLGVDYYLRKRTALGGITSRSSAYPAPIPLTAPVYRSPDGVFFEPGHTWMYLEESGGAKLGIDDFASNLIGSVEEFETRSRGEKVAKGDVLLRVHHGDRTVEFKAPVDGVIDDVNTDLMGGGELRGIEPYTEAWLYRMKPENPSAFVTAMLIGAEAKQWLSHEVDRLKVFLSTIAPRNEALGQTMQDGGVPVSGLIEHLDDAEWKKLEETFFA